MMMMGPIRLTPWPTLQYHCATVRDDDQLVQISKLMSLQRMTMMMKKLA